MLGREAYHRPQLLAEFSQRLRGGAVPDDSVVLHRMVRYAEHELAAGESLAGIVRHMLGMYAGRPGAREFRRLLSEGARETGANAGLLLEAAQRTGVLRSPNQALALGT
jgi:tRNA-dihydrouridine synthase A